MKSAGITLALASLFAGAAMAQTPSIAALVNNYGDILPGLPNYGIAQGSIFVIYGTNLSSTSTNLVYPPLAAMGGVSISVSVNGTVTVPLIYYLLPGQVAAVLPSATPVGTGTITITNAAGTSAPAAITVVQSAFGLLALNGAGSGPSAVFDANNGYAYVGYTAAANPGDVLELWGSGLGPTENDAVSTSVAAPVEVDIGGVPATVQYHGRSQYVGLDQINVVVPPGVSGCTVSVDVVNGTFVSNFGSIAVTATGSRVCSDPVTGIPSSVLAGLGKSGTVAIGSVGIGQSTLPASAVGGGGTEYFGGADFTKFTTAQFNGGIFNGVSLGSCTLYTYGGSNPPDPLLAATWLDAGPLVNINGPDGLIAMPKSTSSSGGETFISYGTPDPAPAFIPAAGGTFNFDNGAGGPDVGAFTVKMVVPNASLVWTNINTFTTLTRSAGATVTWTGGQPGTYVQISGSSLGGSGDVFVEAVFNCNVPVAAGSFAIPKAILLSLPPSFSLDGVSIAGSLSVSNYLTPTTFSAPGIDLGFASAYWLSAQTTIYN